MAIPWGEVVSAGSSLIGGLINSGRQNEMDDFARKSVTHGIRMRVKDATQAGIHPLYAMGANIPTYSPSVSVGGIGDAFASAGQDIGRAVSQGMTPEGRAASTLSTLAVERAGLENDLLRSQIRALNAPGSAPGLPGSGNNADPLKMAGVSIAANPGWSDAQDVENRYGELGDWLYGVPVMAADAAHNIAIRHDPSQQQRFNRIADAVVRRVSKMFGY